MTETVVDFPFPPSKQGEWNGAATNPFIDWVIERAEEFVEDRPHDRVRAIAWDWVTPDTLNVRVMMLPDNLITTIRIVDTPVPKSTKSSKIGLRRFAKLPWT